MKYFGLLVLFAIMTVNCKENKSKGEFNDLDLMSYGLPIVIKAPENAVVESDDLGFIQDVTIKGKENFYIQIQAGTATTTDISAIKNEYLNNVKSGKYFSKILEEEDFGFIFEKDLGGGNLNYDFRYIKIQGDKEYIFQRGLVGQYTIDQVKSMFNAVR